MGNWGTVAIEVKLTNLEGKYRKGKRSWVCVVSWYEYKAKEKKQSGHKSRWVGIVGGGKG